MKQPKIHNHRVEIGDLNESMKYVVVQMNCGDEMSLQVRVNVGSRDETDDIKGISHLLEHMFFQGSKGFPTSKQLEQQIQVQQIFVNQKIFEYKNDIKNIQMLNIELVCLSLIHI